jgi:hypothetical protein
MYCEKLSRSGGFSSNWKKNLGTLGAERVTQGESHIEEDRKQLKEVIEEAENRRVGYQPMLGRRGWFDDECRRVLEGKTAGYKEWIDRTTGAKRLEYEGLPKITHKCTWSDTQKKTNPIAQEPRGEAERQTRLWNMF